MPTKKRNRLATRLILHIATPTLERNTSGKRVIAWSHEVTGQVCRTNNWRNNGAVVFKMKTLTNPPDDSV